MHMAGEVTRGHWIPLVEYSVRNGVSLSTLRRHIKANKIRYRQEEGKYLIYDGSAAAPEKASGRSAGNKELRNLRSKVGQLEQDLRAAQIEISELKTLIALYEEKYPNPFES